MGGHEGLLHGEERIATLFCEPYLVLGDGRRPRSHPGTARVGGPALLTTSASLLVARPSRPLLVVGLLHHLASHVLRPCHAKSPTLVSVFARVSTVSVRTPKVYDTPIKKRKSPFLAPTQTAYTTLLANDVATGSSGENVRRGELQTLPQKPALRLKSGLGERLRGALAQWDVYEKTGATWQVPLGE